MEVAWQSGVTAELQAGVPIVHEQIMQQCKSLSEDCKQPGTGTKSQELTRRNLLNTKDNG